MKTIVTMIFGAAMFVSVISVEAAAQTAEPTFKADPSVYKVIFEDANFRVIEATRNAGVKDKEHGHPVASVSYNLTDCKTKIHLADGKVAESDVKAGVARTVAVVGSHSAENVGSAACKQIFVEKK